MTTTSAAPRVDTGKVTNCRALRFNSLDDALAEAERLAQADREGKLTRLGNWSLGQVLNHLATFINFSYDGFPMKAPWFVKLILKPMKNKWMRGPLPRGKSIPNIEGGTLGFEHMSSDEGLAKFRQSIERLRASAPTQPSPIFGYMRHDEWIALSLRHAELHLGFCRDD